MNSIESKPYNQLINSAEVKKRIGVSSTTLWRLIKAEKIPLPRKVGSLNRWVEADIERYISQPTTQTTKP